MTIRSMFKLFASLPTLLVLLSACPVLSQNGASFPDVISLPNGFQPEGIAIGKETTFYVGSLSSGGHIQRRFEDSFNRVWVAGGVSGGARVYDGDTGELLETYIFSPPISGFPTTPTAVINDVTITNKAAIFTDSGSANDGFLKGSPRIFVVPLEGSTLPPSDVSIVQLVIDEAPDNSFPKLNGIVTIPGDPDRLIICHSSESKLFIVDVETGFATPDPLEIAGCDGMVRKGNTLFLVESLAQTVAEINISTNNGSPTLTRIATYDVTGSEQPTTVGLLGNALYVVDGKFQSTPPIPGVSYPDTPYEVHKVERN